MATQNPDIITLTNLIAKSEAHGTHELLLYLETMRIIPDFMGPGDEDKIPAAEWITIKSLGVNILYQHNSSSYTGADRILEVVFDE